MTLTGFDLVIFDCDGVLVDSERIAVRVDAQVMSALGCAFTEAEIIERFVGCSREQHTALVEARLGRPLDPDWHAEFRHLYLAAFDAELTAVDGVVAALAEIPEPWCVASNSSREGVERNLKLVGLHDRFAGRVFSANDVAEGKPAPDLFLHAAREMGADPARCVVVEDSPYGVRAARAAGMRAFGYIGGLTTAERLADSGAVLFDDMRALPELLRTAGE
ncbi:HAD family hydrolase [Embleya scabrispora]|uniref:HAD family hydrolase n=1 Tax=Embleya scabrispora TaxID=159449 RepID=UPI000380636B|nr:HAD family hydrolase [Embleya scabrispora]